MKRVIAFMMGLVGTTMLASVSFAQMPFQQAGGGEGYGLKAMLALATGLAIGIAAFGGALGQGKAAAAALEGIARNPEASDKVMRPMIIALALIESLVLYALLISIMLWLKL